MSNTRNLQLFVASSLLAAFFVAPCRAAPMLLAQFTLRVGGPGGGSPPATVDFGYRAYQPGPFPTPIYFTWREPYQVSDVGATFLAPTAIIEGANAALRSATAEYSLDIAPAHFATWTLNQPDSCSTRACLEVFVPDIAAHKVTSVERIIDQLIITPEGDHYSLTAAQRIRLWGEPIPEPSTVALLVTAVGIALVTARNRRIRTLQAHMSRS